MHENEKMNRPGRMVEALKRMIGKIGRVPLCNERADRTPHIFGKCFLLCWRCTSLISAMLSAALLCWFFTGRVYLPFRKWEIVCGGILIIPTLADGMRQYLFGRESTNRRRIVLGCISGIGLWLLASWADGVLGIFVGG